METCDGWMGAARMDGVGKSGDVGMRWEKEESSSQMLGNKSLMLLTGDANLIENIDQLI